MSSTNRGGQRSPADDYPTPAWCVHRFLEDEDVQSILLAGGRNWLEPGAGDGAIIRATSTLPEAPWVQDLKWTAVEMREECLPSLVKATKGRGEVRIEDFLYGEKSLADIGKAQKYSVALGNPPFRIAMEFVQRALEVADTVAFLLRLNFLASEKRNAFMRAHAPHVFVLPNRPSFSGDGSTDSPEYGWFIWEHSQLDSLSTGMIKVLKTTHKDVRKEVPSEQPSEQVDP